MIECPVGVVRADGGHSSVHGQAVGHLETIIEIGMGAMPAEAVRYIFLALGLLMLIEMPWSVRRSMLTLRTHPDMLLPLIFANLARIIGAALFLSLWWKTRGMRRKSN